MRYNDIGGDLRISELTLGCWQFAGMTYWGDQDERESVATVHAALDEGITCFDTAEAYGDGVSEQVLGRALKGHRHDVAVASKAAPEYFGRDSLKLACERSLRNLDTDYIDIYQLHWPSRDVPLDETVGALRELVREGKIRTVGVSNFGPLDLGDIQTLIPVVTDQVAYSLLFRAVEHEIVPACVEHNVGILVYSPLAQSLLTGKYASADDVPEDRAATRLYSNERPATRHSEDGCEAEIFAALDEIRAIAGETCVEMAALSLAWLLKRPGVSSVIVGARNAGQIRRNMAAVDFEMPPELVERLCAVTDVVKDRLGGNPDMWQTDSRIR